MHDDFRDFLASLLEAGARFLVVGAHAMAAHGVPRATGDLDVWIETSDENIHRVWTALERFGAPVGSLKLTKQDLATPGTVIQFGVPPTRIDLLTEVTGVAFDAAWASHVVQTASGLQIPFIGRDALLANKRATGRTRDLADVEALERQT